MTEEKLKKAYLRGYSYTRHSQAHKVYPEAENPLETFIKEFRESTVYKEKILPDLRRLSGYIDYNENEKFEFASDGGAEYLLDDLIESFYMGMEDGLLDRPKLDRIDNR